MLKDLVGKDFPRPRFGPFNQRDDAIRNTLHVLVIDPVLGSRFTLVQAASQPGLLVDASSSVAEAKTQLNRVPYSAVLVDGALRDDSAIELLADLRSTHPEVARVLVTEEDGLGLKWQAIERAGLSLLLLKPFDLESVRRNLRELLCDDAAFRGWKQIEARSESRATAAPFIPEDRATRRRDEIVLRGLLAGLNSCETEREVFKLLHSELAERLRISRWLWLDDETGRVTSVAGDGLVDESLMLGRLSREDVRLLDRAHESVRVTRLDLEGRGGSESVPATTSLSLSIHVERRRVHTCVIRLDHSDAMSAVSLLRELQAGLELAFRRIREAERRAVTARELARRVSEELRTPVGALAHAIDRLRGEAERVGLSTQWVDDVSSESQRVIRAVESLEGEILAEPTGMMSTTS